jgi:hypothetical protein
MFFAALDEIDAGEIIRLDNGKKALLFNPLAENRSRQNYVNLARLRMALGIDDTDEQSEQTQPEEAATMEAKLDSIMRDYFTAQSDPKQTKLVEDIAEYNKQIAFLQSKVSALELELKTGYNKFGARQKAQQENRIKVRPIRIMKNGVGIYELHSDSKLSLNDVVAFAQSITGKNPTA